MPTPTRFSTSARHAAQQRSALEDEDYENDGQAKPDDDDVLANQSSSRISLWRAVRSTKRTTALARRPALESEKSVEDDDDGEVVSRHTSRKLSRRMMRSSSEMSRHLGEKFGAPDHGEHASWRYWLQEKTGILRFRMHIAASKFESDYSCLAAKELVELLKFEIFVGVLILGNAAQMFFAAMYKPGEVVPLVIALSEHLFVFVFLLEWVLRILGHGWVWMFWSKMNLFDTCIVWVTGVLVTWMLPPLGVDATILRRLSALRVLRLGRIIRAIRSMPQFRELWTFVHGMLTCMYLVFWAGLIIFGVHYMFGIFIMETITKSDTFKDDDG